MSVSRSEYLSSVWADGIFGEHSLRDSISFFISLINIIENRVLFITGGAGSIGSAQTRAIVHLGANACIIGRSVEKTESAAKEIAKVRPGAKVLGIGGVDVRNVSCGLYRDQPLPLTVLLASLMPSRLPQTAALRSWEESIMSCESYLLLRPRDGMSR